MHGKVNDLTGRVFGDITVLRYDASSQGSGTSKWFCRCKCGKEFIKSSDYLGRRAPKYCRHLTAETPHYSVTPKSKKISEYCKCPEMAKKLYRTYKHMIKRCHDPSNPNFERYGKKGIKVCPEWLSSYDQFVKDMGPAPSLHHSIDRIDNSLGYSKDNCRWADIYLQRRNQARTIEYTAFGQTLCLSDWAEYLKIPLQTLWDRVHLWDMPIEEAINKSLKGRELPMQQDKDT